MMKRLDIRFLIDGIVNCLRQFPMEVASAVAFCVFAQLSVSARSSLVWDNFCAFFPVVIVAVWSANRIFRSEWRVLYYAALPVAIGLLVIFQDELWAFVQSSAYPFSLLLAAFVFFVHHSPADNLQFSRSTYRRIVNALASVAVGLLLSFAVNIIIISIEYIFSVSTGQLAFRLFFTRVSDKIIV